MLAKLGLLCHTEIMASWHELAIEVPVELGDAVASFLFDQGSTGLETIDLPGNTLVKAYFSSDPPIEGLRRFCFDLCSNHPATWDPVIHTRPVVEEDWAENWKQHFQPLRVGRRLYVCPPWDTGSSEGRCRIFIHPGMAFGTGQHPTTRGCLELIETAADSMRITRALDIGTGSGILAIALSKLGAREVLAVDNDHAACEVARDNISMNGCLQITVASRLQEISGTFDLIVANLFTNLLVELVPAVRKYLRPDGVFVCSGFLIADEAAITSSYEGFSVRRRRAEDGWVSLAMDRTGS
jgi:ribosomal protein L11 methyltransferase